MSSKLRARRWKDALEPASIHKKSNFIAGQFLQEDEAVSLAEIVPVVQALSRLEKIQLARLLIEEIANDDSAVDFKKGHVYPIYTPEYAPGAAAQLAQVLKDFEAQP